LAIGQYTIDNNDHCPNPYDGSGFNWYISWLTQLNPYAGGVSRDKLPAYSTSFKFADIFVCRARKINRLDLWGTWQGSNYSYNSRIGVNLSYPAQGGAKISQCLRPSIVVAMADDKDNEHQVMFDVGVGGEFSYFPFSHGGSNNFLYFDGHAESQKRFSEGTDDHYRRHYAIDLPAGWKNLWPGANGH
ncbi:MAG: hypothetical protein WCS73_01915, partial [Lentisphaeria bacterium]